MPLSDLAPFQHLFQVLAVAQVYLASHPEKAEEVFVFVIATDYVSHCFRELKRLSVENNNHTPIIELNQSVTEAKKILSRAGPALLFPSDLGDGDSIVTETHTQSHAATAVPTQSHRSHRDTHTVAAVHTQLQRCTHSHRDAHTVTDSQNDANTAT